jgi:virginiamycin B lyase
MLARILAHTAALWRSCFRRSMRALSHFGQIMACVGVLMGCSGSPSTVTPAATPFPALRGAIEEFAIPTPGSDSYGITIGPEGNLWFTESKPFKIGRITPQGAITEFPIATSPAANAFVTDIAAGPDGNLWFTAVNGASEIGRVTPQGVFAEFPLPSPDGDPIGIVTGPDKALWFTEASANKIGRITTSGSMTEFPVPTPRGNPIGITAGPDGALWFTESGRFTGGELGGGNKIGRITPQGVITEFPLPTQSDPHEIAAGPDGALWFTEGKANKIGRITTNGSITELPAPTPQGYPWAITSGPDKTLWFTERIGKIGKVS